MQTLVIVTTVCIFVANLQVEFVSPLCSKNEKGKGHIPLVVSGIAYQTYSYLLTGRVLGKVKSTTRRQNVLNSMSLAFF